MIGMVDARPVCPACKGGRTGNPDDGSRGPVFCERCGGSGRVGEPCWKTPDGYPVVGETFGLPEKQRLPVVRAQVSMDTTKPALQRLGEAVFLHGVKVQSSHVLGLHMGFTLGRGISGELLLDFPFARLDAIKATLGKSVIDFRPPPVISTN